ncbi:MAG: adenylyl-sulfate kinase [Patescibacteria group bacterium]
MVIWITGLSASGKTTLGKAVYDAWKAREQNTVFVDGDHIRKIFQHDKKNESYTMEERRKNADRICDLCAWLDSQGINVVCCILSLFEESRKWNRENYSKYFEVFIDVPMDVLMKREIKGLYKAAKAGELKNVVGVDIPFAKPANSDFVLDNSADNVDFKKVAAEILTKAQSR